MMMLRRALAAAMLLVLAGCAVPAYGPVAYNGYYGYPYAYYGYPYAYAGGGFLFFPHHRHFFFRHHRHFFFHRHRRFHHHFAPRVHGGFPVGGQHR